MIKFALFILISLTTISANVNDFFHDTKNPNGDPFVLSLGIEKNIHSFKYYNESTFYATLPLSNIITFKYRENVRYDSDMVILKSDHDAIQFLDKHYALELHLPLNKIWDR